jgi:outer membrane lipopolysaccharide assembly protein LptE/RlpB
MHRILKWAALAAVGTSLAGCGVGMSKPSDSKAREMTSKITYIQDATTGICYALVATSHQLTISDDGMSMTYVPCTTEVLARVVH